MGQALDRLRVLFARTYVGRHLRATEYGVEDVEAHWRDLPSSVRKTFKESMHAPSVQGGESHPFDKPDARPLKSLSPGERAAFEAVQLRVGESKAEALKARVGEDTRSAGYLKAGRASQNDYVRQVMLRHIDEQHGFRGPGTNDDQVLREHEDLDHSGLLHSHKPKKT